jgi:hypothetical protein
MKCCVLIPEMLLLLLYHISVCSNFSISIIILEKIVCSAIIEQYHSQKTRSYGFGNIVLW